MEHERLNIKYWLNYGEGASIDNINSIVDKLTDQEVATFYLAILTNTSLLPIIWKF